VSLPSAGPGDSVRSTLWSVDGQGTAPPDTHVRVAGPIRAAGPAALTPIAVHLTWYFGGCVVGSLMDQERTAMPLTSSSRVVVLGGTSGIGFAVAEAAAKAGARVVIASRNPESVAAAVERLPGSASGQAVDASSSAGLADFFEGVGAFDHLVYTAAGNLVSMPLRDYTPEKARDFLGLRLVSALEAVRLAVPHLAPAGSITLTSGTAAFKGGEGWLLGAAVSGAMISAAKSLAAELAPIRVNVVAPGMTRSPVWAQLPEEEREAVYRDTAASLPLRRVGEVEDMAKAYVQLMDQDYATGVVSVVDGGTLIV